MRITHAPAPLVGRTEAEAHVGITAFKLGPPRLIGAELEFLVHHREDRSIRPALSELAAALGEHAPTTVSPRSPALPLPSGSIVTVEPGGQVELSSSPHPDARSLCDALINDTEVLGDRLAGRDLRAVSRPADTHRAPHRLLHLGRYDAMEAAFDRVGPYGRAMMTNTAATQVSVDAGAPGRRFRERWALLHDAGPALLAAFACSPELNGAPSDRWASQRMRMWLDLDPARTTPPPTDGDDPVHDYASWAIDAPLLGVRRPGGWWTHPPGATFDDWLAGRLDEHLPERPTADDLDHHLSTLFPPVRACGHLEVRYLDAQPGRLWQVPVAVLEALLRDDATTRAARAVAASTRGRWRAAARVGLADPRLRGAGVELLTMAVPHVRDPGLAGLVVGARDRVRSGHPPSAPAEPTFTGPTEI